MLTNTLGRACAALLAISTAGTALAIDTSRDVGTPNGTFEVSPSGSATYSVAITVPPGTAGMQPQLSIQYDSMTGRTQLGRGFSLGGISSITRCPGTLDQDGIVDGVDFDSYDRLCLDGQRLQVLATGPAYGASGATYFTEMESFTKVVQTGDLNAVNSTFEARTKSGLIYAYGVADAAVKVPGINQLRAETMSWLVKTVTDRAGNYMEFTYEQDGTYGKEHRLLQIDYAGNAGTLPNNRVEFEYETRPDLWVMSLDGGYFTSTKRLKAIHTYANDTPVRSYWLEYQVTAVAGSAPIHIKECSPLNCLPDLTFTWTTQSQGFLPQVNTGASSHGSSRIKDIAADFSGDGKADLLTWNRPLNNDRYNLHVSQGDGNFYAAVATNVQGYGDDNVNSYDTGDFNGDGLLDLMMWHVPFSYKFAIYLNNGNNGFSAPVNSNIPSQQNGYQRNIIADFDGDGRSDVLVWNLPNAGRYNLYRSLGDGTFATPEWTPIQAYNSSSNPHLVGDFNGDGLPDILAYNVSPLYPNMYALYYNNGNGFDNVRGTTVPAVENSKLRHVVADFNGDGLSDVLVYNRPYMNGQWNLYVSTGGKTYPHPFFNGALVTPIPGYGQLSANNYHVGDWNCDGAIDMLVYHKPLLNSQFNFYINNGRGEFTSGGATGINTYDNPDIPNLVEDFDGDGCTDLLVWHRPTNDSKYHLYRTVTSPPPAVTTITSGLDSQILIEYKPLTDSSVYEKGSGSVYPRHEVIAPLHVVSRHRATNGLGTLFDPGYFETTYKYKGLRGHARGRGVLGFASVEITDVSRGRVQSTAYLQDFPYTGLVSSTEAKLISGARISSSSIDYAPQYIGGVAGGYSTRYFVYPSVETSRDYEINDGIGAAERKRTVTQNTYYTAPDQLGNLWTSTVSVFDGLATTGFVTTIANVYESNNLVTWVLGRLSQSTVSRTTPEGPTAPSRTSAFEYGASGFLKKEIIEPGTAYEFVKEYQRDSFGNITVTTVGTGPAARTTTVQYDSRGQFVYQITNALGHTETHEYYPETGALKSVTGPNGRKTTWLYDAYGRKTLEVRPDGTSTQLARAWCAGSSPACIGGGVFKISTIGSDGGQSIVEHDVVERPLRAAVLAFNGDWIYQQTEYNTKGEVERKSAPRFASDPEEYWTTFLYDAVGRMTQENAPVDQNTPSGKITSIAYDGLTTTLTNPLGQTSTKTLNALGKVKQVVDASGVLEFEYDSFENLVKSTDPAGNEVVMTYDDRGRKTSMLDPDMSLSEPWIYTYNYFSELVQQRDAKLQTVTMAYDKLGRMTSRTEAEGTTTWGYDSAWIGALATVSRSDGYQRSQSYDALGRPSTTTYSIDSVNYSYNYSYDPQGRVAAITYPGGFWVAHQYNQYGYQYRVGNTGGTLQSAITCTPTTLDGIVVDVCNSSAATLTTQHWTLEATDARGQERLSSQGNLVSTLREYDLATGYLSTILATVSNLPDVQDLEYEWNKLGNLTDRIDQRQGGLSEHVTYDGVNRVTLSQVSAGGGAALTDVAVTYDNASGNILSKSGVGAYTYGGSRPHAVTSVTGDRATTYTYDANGNQLTGAGRTMTWSSFNKPTSMEVGANRSDYTYGPDRESIKQFNRHVLSGGLTVEKTVTYVGGIFERHTAASGVPVNKYYVQAGGRAVAIFSKPDDVAGSYQYLHYDHLGSVDAVTNEQGVVLERFSYDAFGKRRADTWQNDPADLQLKLARVTDWGYTGQQHLDNVGLIHYGGRVYDPILGRFTSADPIIPAPADSQSYNRYSYVRNNPLSLTDPSGFSWWGKQVNRVGNETKRWERDFRHEIRRPGSLLGPALMVYGTSQCGGHPICVAAVSVTVARMQGVTSGGELGKIAIISGLTAGGHNLAGGSIVAHGVVEALSARAQGQSMGGGFLSGMVGAMVPTSTNPFIGTLVAAVAGGTMAELGGGKFANGAATAAFAYLVRHASGTGSTQAEKSAADSSSAVDGQPMSIDKALVALEGTPWAGTEEGVATVELLKKMHANGQIGFSGDLGPRVRATYNPDNGKILVSLNVSAAEVAGRLAHEGIHALRNSRGQPHNFDGERAAYNAAYAVDRQMGLLVTNPSDQWIRDAYDF